MSFRSLASILLVPGLLVVLASGLRADGEGHNRGRSSRLTPPEGAASPRARGEVRLTDTALIVKVEHLPAGDYKVTLDDGKGVMTAIGTITVTADDEDDDDDVAGGGNEEEHEHHGDGGEGALRLSGADLPFGVTNPADLGGRAISVEDKDAKVVLSGKTPAPIAHEPQNEQSGRCPLSRPDPAVDADAEGVLKLESGGGRMVIKVHLSDLDAGKVYDVVLTNPADSKSESLGKVTINDGGNGRLKVDSDKGDAIPFGAGDLKALEGFAVAVNNDAGAAVLVGKVCAAEVDEEDHDDDDDHHGDVGPRCFSAKLSGDQEVPPVTTTATGTAVFIVKGEDGSTLRYQVKVTGLSGPAIAAHIHVGDPGVAGPVVIPLDAATLEGEITGLTAENRAALAAGKYYVNVHTAANPDGEIRGQIGACARDDDEDDDHEDDEEDDDHEDHDGHPGPRLAGGGSLIETVEPKFLVVGDFDTAFLRGDVNQDAGIDISDALTTLEFLYAGGVRPYCMDAADANDDGRVDLTDAIGILTYLFLGGAAPSDPGTLIPGSDPTPDALYCEEMPLP